MLEARFKIDRIDSYYCPFGLYARERAWHTWLTGRWNWREIYRDDTVDKLKERYEKLKDLPVYL